MKLIGTHQRLVYADDVNILGGAVHTEKINTETLVFASNETGLTYLLTYLLTYSTVQSPS